MEEQISLKEYVDQRFKDSEKAIAIAFSSHEKKTEQSEKYLESWQHSANEWRGAMVDRERNFLTRKEFYTMVATTVGIITLGIITITLLVLILR